jgi:heme oxygenase
VATIEPRPGTHALIDHVASVASSEPVRLLGLHYVREGANNGNRFIAMKLRKIWGAPHDQRDGFRYLDPYGPEQRPRWEAFKQQLDALDLTNEQEEAVIASARSMFNLIIAMHKDHDLPPLPPAEDKAPTHG